jgi:hypothetical protein
MPLLRPPSSAAIARRRFSTTLRRRGGGGGGAGHESHYDPPTGWFLNTPPGETAKKEGWEGIMYWGFFGSLMVAGVAYAYKPDTSWVLLFFFFFLFLGFDEEGGRWFG